MKQQVDHALEECLTLLEQGQLTPEECLHRYPDYADELRVLIPIAHETRRVSLPSPSPAALKAWERQMFAALDRKQQRPAPRRVFGWAFPLRRLAYVATLLLVALLVGTYFYFGPGATTVQAATLTGVSGSVKVLPAGDAIWKSASAGQKVNAGDRIRVGSLSAATLSFPGGCSTDLEANTDVDLLRINVQRNGRGGAVVLYQRLGQTRNCVQHSAGYESRFEIRTPSANVIARETEFTVTVEDDGVTDVAVAEGTVEVMSQALSIFVQSGEGTSVEPERPPIPVYTIPALTREPGVTLGTEEPGHETPEPDEPQETEELEEPEPPEPEETEEPEDHEIPESGKPEETEEPEEPKEPEEPEEPEESEESEESEEPEGSEESKSEESREHETPEPGEPHKTEAPDEHE